VVAAGGAVWAASHLIISQLKAVSFVPADRGRWRISHVKGWQWLKWFHQQYSETQPRHGFKWLMPQTAVEHDGLFPYDPGN
jgi:hypothetical protein